MILNLARPLASAYCDSWIVSSLDVFVAGYVSLVEADSPIDLFSCLYSSPETEWDK